MQYAFEDCVLDDERRELWRAASPVPVGPQVFDLLAYLIHNRERVVTQDDLLASVWEGRIVSDSTLRSHINAARGAIGDNGEAQRLIRTMPRKGFRFVGEVREQQQTGTKPVAAADRATEVVQRAAVEPAAGGDRSAALPAIVASAPVQSEAPAPAARRPRLNGVLGAALIGSAALLLVIVAGLVIMFRNPGSASNTSSLAEYREAFDPTVVPFLSDENRRALASYSALPTAKALALSESEWGLASGAPDLASAKKEALERCERRAATTANCKIYATDLDVVWSRKSLPMPLDVDVHSGSARRSPGDRRPPAGQLRRPQVAERSIYPVHVMTRKSFGFMTRKLSVTESQRSAQFRGTFSRRKPSVASANWAQVA